MCRFVVLRMLCLGHIAQWRAFGEQISDCNLLFITPLSRINASQHAESFLRFLPSLELEADTPSEFYSSGAHWDLLSRDEAKRFRRCVRMMHGWYINVPRSNLCILTLFPRSTPTVFFKNILCFARCACGVCVLFVCVARLTTERPPERCTAFLS